LFLQASQDISRRASARSIQYTIEDANLDELIAWAPRLLAAFKSLPELQDVAPTSKPTRRGDGDDRPQHGGPLRHPAAAD